MSFVRRQGDRVRRHVVLALPDSQDDRRPHPRRDENAGLAARRDEDRVGARELRGGAAHRRQQVAVELGLDFVGEDLRVGLAREAVARGRERRPPFGEVLEDPVVDDDDLAGAVGLRMGVDLGRPAVRGPAGVPDPRRAGGRARVEKRDEVGELPGTAQNGEAPVGERRDCRRSHSRGTRAS
jgi:hypothetical protein